MKAAICRKFGEPLSIEEVSIASPRQKQVKVRVASCAICHSDIHSIDGSWGGELPAVFGHEAAGEVVEVGSDVENIRSGDHVTVSLIRSCKNCFYCDSGEPQLCESKFPDSLISPLRDQNGNTLVQGFDTGAFAEFVVVDQSQVVPIPKDMPFDCSALLACGVITGTGAVINTAKVVPGSHVVVIGVGGVGLNCIQGARLCEARTVTAVDLVDEKLDAAKTFGATHTINSSKDDVKQSVIRICEGRGADYVFVSVGSVAAFEQGLTLLRPAGTLVVVGMPSVGDRAALEVFDVVDHCFRIVGSLMGSTILDKDIPNLVKLYKQQQLMLEELITGRFPLEQINDAIANVTRGNALRNVIVFGDTERPEESLL